MKDGIQIKMIDAIVQSEGIRITNYDSPYLIIDLYVLSDDGVYTLLRESFVHIKNTYNDILYKQKNSTNASKNLDYYRYADKSEINEGTKEISTAFVNNELRVKALIMEYNNIRM